jgi:hypothetical protein
VAFQLLASQLIANERGQLTGGKPTGGQPAVGHQLPFLAVFDFMNSLLQYFKQSLILISNCFDIF